ncbi:hypothetical protein GRI75_10605 [Altererythrobacter soli]|uniref:Uncharacterized protein n=1 Tax=Croceibacterium soli TaxID=1739690 RepID=A0A6I4UT49_9SPHN|nr:hypothetical protein [Croceibacterium soli]MXP42090.1 hypothetical protein [Croceibacterium soli]
MKASVFESAGVTPATDDACTQEHEKHATEGLHTTPADKLLEIFIARYLGEQDELLAKVRRLNALRTRSEDARKRCLSVKSKTTPNADRIRALREFLGKKVELIRPLIGQLVEHMAAAEMARQELHIYQAAERQIRRERSERDQRQLTPLTYDFVDALYTHHGIDGSALSCLEEKDFRTIAELVRKRHAEVVPELYTSEEAQ